MWVMKVFGCLVSIALLVIIGGLIFTHLSPDYKMYLVRSGSMRPAVNIVDMVITGPENGPINGVIRPGTIVTYEHGNGLFFVGGQVRYS